jgi:hypothetical protein
MSFGVRTPFRSRPRAPLPRQRDRRVGTELARASERSPCDFPWTTDEDAACRRLLSETTTSTHSSSISLRRPRMTCATHGVPGEPGVFTTPKPAGRDPQRCSGRHFFLLRALGPSSGRPCRNLHSRPRPSRGRAEMPLRVGGGPSWRPPRSLPPSIREDRRLSRSGTPSLGEHPSRVFLRARGFAASARPLVVPFLPRDGARESETPGHTATGFPPGRCFAGSNDAHRFLQYDRRADTPRTPRLPLSGMPSGILVPAHLREDMREACGPAAPRDCSRITIRTGPERARAARAMRDR